MFNDTVKKIFFRNILLFVLFGFAISVATTYIHFYLEYEKIQHSIDKNAADTYKKIDDHLNNFRLGAENTLTAIATNQLFQNYIDSPSITNQKNVQQLFLNNIQINRSFFQLRFLDRKGMEKIRAERNRTNNQVFLVSQDQLQDKAHRYYFKMTHNTENTRFWHSNLDLNIEHGIIEHPIRPTYRIATKIIHNGGFYGILIANIDMTYVLDFIHDNSHFHTYMVDNDGYFILHPDTNKHWSRYLSPQNTIWSEFPDINRQELKSDNLALEQYYLYPLESYFSNGENLKLILHAKDAFIQFLTDEHMAFSLTLFILILLFSITIGFLISIPTARMQIKLNTLLDQNQHALETIDKHVITITTDTHKQITSASQAFCDISGYQKNELIGQNVNIFKSGTMEESVYQSIREALKMKKTWSGELQSKAKDGHLYWMYTTILPVWSIDGNHLEGYRSFSADISNKKQVETLSETDALTGIYNRMKMDALLADELKRFNRYQHPFCVLMLDIDHFKTVNDTFGHQVGDQVLIEIAKLLKDNARETDYVGRWGGEEFLILSTDTELEGAKIFAENIRAAIEQFGFKEVGQKTASIGVSEMQAGDTNVSLIKRADDALYRAKHGGRNQVVTE